MRKTGLGTILALAFMAGVLILAIVFVAVGWDVPAGGEQMSITGWVAMVLGVIATLALGIGLVMLMLYSSRTGRD